jgi:hypothetical protein
MMVEFFTKNKFDHLVFSDAPHPDSETFKLLFDHADAAPNSNNKKVRLALSLHREAVISILNQILNESDSCESLEDQATATPLEFSDCLLSAISTDTKTELKAHIDHLESPGWLPRSGQRSGDDTKDVSLYLQEISAGDKLRAEASTWTDAKDDPVMKASLVKEPSSVLEDHRYPSRVTQHCNQFIDSLTAAKSNMKDWRAQVKATQKFCQEQSIVDDDQPAIVANVTGNCHGCGKPGHFKRDCPTGGHGSGGRNASHGRGGGYGGGGGRGGGKGGGGRNGGGGGGGGGKSKPKPNAKGNKRSAETVNINGGSRSVPKCTYGMDCEGIFAACSFYHGTPKQVFAHLSKKFKGSE